MSAKGEPGSLMNSRCASPLVQRHHQAWLCHQLSAGSIASACRVQSVMPRTFIPVMPPVTPRSQPAGKGRWDLVGHAWGHGASTRLRAAACSSGAKRLGHPCCPLHQQLSLQASTGTPFTFWAGKLPLTVGPAADHARQDAGSQQPSPATLVLAAAAAIGPGWRKHSHAFSACLGRICTG